MSADPFDIELIRARLLATVPMQTKENRNGLRLVGLAADYAAVASLADFPAPCAYVVLLGESPAQTKSGMSLPGQQTRLAQLVDVSFGVIVAVRNLREQRGEQVLDDLRLQLGEIRQQLLGWTPNVAGGRACQLTEGRLEDYDKSTALWTDIWSTQSLIKSKA